MNFKYTLFMQLFILLAYMSCLEGTQSMVDQKIETYIKNHSDDPLTLEVISIAPVETKRPLTLLDSVVLFDTDANIPWGAVPITILQKSVDSMMKVNEASGLELLKDLNCNLPLASYIQN